VKYRKFTLEFKRSIIEQLLSETVGPTELCRRYNISSGLLHRWKNQYAEGKLNAELSREAELAARVQELVTSVVNVLINITVITVFALLHAL